MRYRIFAAVLAVVAVLGSAPAARAGLIPVDVSINQNVSGNYTYTYAIVLPTGSVLQPGDYFTIYNFAGLVSGSATASGNFNSSNWTFSTSLVGPTPSGVLPTDNPNIPNLTWTYNGPVIQGAQTGLGNFSAVSIYPNTTQSWLAALTGTNYGGADSNITPTNVPVPTAPPPGVPEPATLALAALALPLLGLARALRARRNLAAA